MKKLKSTLAALMLICIAAATAAPKAVVTETVLSAFSKTFAKASNVTWTESDGFYFAHFEDGSVGMSVAYDEEGRMVATSKALYKADLPATLVSALQNKYKDFRICNPVSEITLEGEKSYYLYVENDKKLLRLKCSPNGKSISIDKKTKKSNS